MQLWGLRTHSSFSARVGATGQPPLLLGRARA